MIAYCFVLFVKAWRLGSLFLLLDKTRQTIVPYKIIWPGIKESYRISSRGRGWPTAMYPPTWNQPSPPLFFFISFQRGLLLYVLRASPQPCFRSRERQWRSVLFPIFLRRRQNLGVTGPTLRPMPMKGEEKECVRSLCDSRPSPPYSMDSLNGLGYVPHDSLAFFVAYIFFSDSVHCLQVFLKSFIFSNIVLLFFSPPCRN